MNCRPGDLAYLDLPAHAQIRDQIQGMVVTVISLAAPDGYVHVSGPLWRVAPELELVCDKHYRYPSPTGERLLRPGDRVTCNTFPDAHLRPIRGQSEDESVTAEKELENVN